MRVPAVLVPYPPATDNHQFHNARAFEATGAARLLEQKTATPELLVQLVRTCWRSRRCMRRCRDALAQWHAPRAAEQIAEAMLVAVGVGAGEGCQADPQSAAPPRSRTPKTGDNSQASWPPQADRFADRPHRGIQDAAARQGGGLEPTRRHSWRRQCRPSAEAANGLAQHVSPATVIRRDEPLAKHTTLRVGGPADVYVEPASEQDLAAVPGLLSGAAAGSFSFLGAARICW